MSSTAGLVAELSAFADLVAKNRMPYPSEIRALRRAVSEVAKLCRRTGTTFDTDGHCDRGEPKPT